MSDPHSLALGRDTISRRSFLGGAAGIGVAGLALASPNAAPFPQGAGDPGSTRRGVDDASILNPRNTWQDKAAYDAQAVKLRDMFRQNFESKGFAQYGIEPRI